MKLNLNIDIEAVEIIPETAQDAKQLGALGFLGQMGRIRVKPPTKPMKEKKVNGFIAIKIDADLCDKLIKENDGKPTV